MVLFVCEDSVDGIFSGIYDAWDSRLGHYNVGLRISGRSEPELFAEYREVVSDSVKATKVAETIRRKMGESAYEHIYQAALSDDEKKTDSIYRVLAVGLSKHTAPYLARHLMDRLQNPDVCHIFQLSCRTGREANRYIEFVRFRELENGVLFSEIDAEAQILPLIGGHFADRFPNEDFMIYDHGHGDAIVHSAGKQWLIWKSADLQPFLNQSCSSMELEMQQLWRRFCDSISIAERENPELQMQFWPLKYRKWMTEGERI